MGDAADSRRQELFNHLGSLIDRASFGSVKTAFQNADDIQSIIMVDSTIRLEDVAIMRVSDELADFKRLCESRLIHFVVPDSYEKQSTEVEFSEIPDWRSLRVLLIASTYLIQEDPSEPQPLREEGKLICKTCNEVYEVDEDNHYMAPPWSYGAGCAEYCLRCWLLGGPAKK